MAFKNDKVYVVSASYPDADAELMGASVVTAEGTEVNDTAVDENADADGEVMSTDADAVTLDDSPVSINANLTVMDEQGNEISSTPLEMSSDTSVYSLDVDDKGNVYILFERYSWDPKTESGEESFWMTAVSESGEIKWQYDIASQKPGYDANEYFYVNSIKAVGDCIILCSTNKIIIVDQNGELVCENSEGFNGDWYEVVCTNDKKAYLKRYNEKGICFNELDLKNGRYGSDIEANDRIAMGSLYAGGKYDMLMQDSNAVYAYNVKDDEPIKLVDMLASDISVANMRNMTMKDDSNILAVYDEDDYRIQHLVRFVKVDPKDVVDKDTLVIGSLYMPEEVRKHVVEFNKSSETCRIQLKDYSITSDEYEKMIEAVNNDIISGNEPDIFIGNMSLPMSSYMAKGIFEDLDPYIESDPDIDRSDYLENVLDTMRVDGKLYGLVPSFHVSTVLAKTSIVGKKTHWTMDEFNELMNSYGETTEDFGKLDKTSFLYTAMWHNGNAYVDLKNGEAKFDTPEFIKLLEHTERYPDEIDYDSDEIQEYWDNYDTLYREDRALLMSTSIYDFREIIQDKQGSFGEEISYIGFPTENGIGGSIEFDYSFLISASSKHKDKAWEFVRYFLTEDFQDNLQYNFPVLESSFDKKGEKATQKPTYKDENGKDIEYTDYYYLNGVEIELDPMTKEEVAEFKDYVKSLTTATELDDKVINLVLEEAKPYFKGQKSAAETAAIIQSRVQVYLDENR